VGQICEATYVYEVSFKQRVSLNRGIKDDIKIFYTHEFTTPFRPQRHRHGGLKYLKAIITRVHKQRTQSLLRERDNGIRFGRADVDLSRAPDTAPTENASHIGEYILRVVHRSTPAFGEHLSNSSEINSTLRAVKNHRTIELRNVVSGLVLADVNESLLQPIRKKPSAHHTWTRNEAKIPGDGWVQPGILCHDAATYQRGYAVYNQILLQGGIQADQKTRILVHS
jgi:hypothetical protein